MKEFDLFRAVKDLLHNAKAINIPIKKNMNPADIKKIKALKQLQEKLSLLVDNWYTSEFVVELKKGGLTIAPLKANKLSKILFANAERVVFMSATVAAPVVSSARNDEAANYIVASNYVRWRP